MTTKRKDIVEAVPEKTRDLTLFEEMDRMFDTLFHHGWLRPFHEMFPETVRFGEPFDFKAPRLDVIDRDEELLVRAELPGVEKKDLEVDLTGQTLTIKGERRVEEKETEGDYFRAEISRGAFSRRIHLPEEVDTEHIKADFDNGMLEVHLPKTHKVERRRIKVE